MRRYAVLLGMLLIVGYGYAAQLALTAERPAGARRSADTTGWNDRIWYGGTLAPITVEAHSDPVPAKLGTKTDSGAATACVLPGDTGSRSGQKGESPARARSERASVKVS